MLLLLRKSKVSIFFLGISAYFKNIHECLFISAGATLVVSGDGRYYSKDAVQVIAM